MATLKIYHDEDNTFYNVDIELQQAILDDGSGEYNFYLLISTNMKYINGDSFPTFRIKSLNDLPQGAGPVSNWTDLINAYINYFVMEAELGMSSSSSSSSTSSSSTSSSSSSSTSSTSPGI